MNSVFELAIHLFLAMPLSWIYLPSLVRRKEEHLHIGGLTRTCHCRPTATEYDVVRSGLVDLQDAADARALLQEEEGQNQGNQKSFRSLSRSRQDLGFSCASLPARQPASGRIVPDNR